MLRIKKLGVIVDITGIRPYPVRRYFDCILGANYFLRLLSRRARGRAGDVLIKLSCVRGKFLLLPELVLAPFSEIAGVYEGEIEVSESYEAPLSNFLRY